MHARLDGVTIEDERRPGNQAAVRSLFQAKPEGFSDLVYGYYSAIAHGVAWGLLESVTMPNAPNDESNLTTPTGYPARSSQSMTVTLGVCADAYRIATTARHDHMGWHSDHWTTFAQQLDAEAQQRFSTKTP